MNIAQHAGEVARVMIRGVRLDRVEFDCWSSTLDDALSLLPEDDDCPHRLIKLLAQHRSGRPKKIWLLSQDGMPVALAPMLKVDAFSWQPVTQYIVPGVVIPAVTGRLFDALEGLGLNMRVALWRTTCGLPQGPRIRDVDTTPTHGIDCAEDFEAYWKSTDMWRNLRSARNKTQNLILKENAPGASDWIITNWARKWGVPDDDMQDRLITARFLEEQGKHFSLTLYDGDVPVAGQTCLSHRGEMVGQCIYRSDENGSLSKRLVHLTFCWAKEKGFSAIDIGGGQDYKRKFAPARGERHEFTMSMPQDFAHRALNGVKSRLKRLVTH
jgi:hypothetical protein